jgi:fibronectin-binding autotransporter adhesin
MGHISESLNALRRYSLLVCFTIAASFIEAPDRAHAALIEVNSLDDNTVNGDTFCTLREAITAANQNADFNDCRGIGSYGADTITFSVSGVITPGSDSAFLPLPDITDAAGLIIDGLLSTISTTRSNGSAFSVDRAALTLSRLNVRGRGSSGLPLNCIVNRSGTVTIINSTVSRCSARFGGGIHNSSDGTVTIINSTLALNSAEIGGGIRNDGGTVTIIDSLLEENSAVIAGGGIFNERGTVTISNSTLALNSATGRVAPGDGGGGIRNDGGTVTIINSLLGENSAVIAGGGIRNDGEFSTVKIINSNLTENVAQFGGGIYNHDSGTVTIVNSTLAGNSARVRFSRGGGGGINNDSGTVTIVNSTLWRNSERNLDFDQIVGSNIATEIGALNLGRTTIANSIVAIGEGLGTTSCSGDSGIVDGGFNIDDGRSCGFSAAHHSQPHTDPELDPAGLQNNGGPTTTIALLSRSPAIDAIPNGTNGCGTTIRTDQRGFVRPAPAGGNCDIGAFERGGAPTRP